MMLLRGTVFSRTLEMETGIAIVAPDADSGGSPYRVCYLLHGLCGSCGNFIDYTMLPVYAEKYRTIFIMPEAGRSFYADMKRGQKFFSYVAEELPGICRRIFNIAAAGEDTAIMGASMGGYGALKCALGKPGQYGRCCAFSSACLFLREGLDAMRAPGGEAQTRAAFGDRLYNDFLSIFGDELRLNPGDDILELAKEAVGHSAKIRLYLACGEGDSLLGENRRFCAEIRKMGYGPTYEEWPGGHEWSFFDSALRKALEWCYGGQGTP